MILWHPKSPVFLARMSFAKTNEYLEYLVFRNVATHLCDLLAQFLFGIT